MSTLQEKIERMLENARTEIIGAERMCSYDWHNGFRTPFYLTSETKLDKNQGWKLHISTSNVKSYAFMLGELVPELIFNHVDFKIASYPYFETLLNPEDPQAGKLITIYLTEKSLKGLKNLTKETLQSLIECKRVIPVKGELHVAGKIYARYGSYRHNYIVTPEGEQIPDDRTICKPFFVEKDITLEDIFY